MTKVCVIGAGPSGITALKNLIDQGLDTVCYNSTVNLYNVSSVFPGLGYVWTTAIGNITTGQGTNQINLDVTGVNGGFYNNALSVIGVNQLGCQSLPQTFTIVDLNILPVITPVGPFCEYDEYITLMANPSGGIFSGMNVWGDQYYKRLSQSKMALNLSRGLPFKWYSSDRISSFIPNGITTFVDRATKLDDFFSDDEVVFYKNINDLVNLINELKNNDKKRRSIGQKGRIKYNTHFNSTKVAKFIFEKTLNLKLSEKYFWDK